MLNSTELASQFCSAAAGLFQLALQPAAASVIEPIAPSSTPGRHNLCTDTGDLLTLQQRLYQCVLWTVPQP